MSASKHGDIVTVLAIDPGVKSPGYAVWDAWEKRHIYVGNEAPTMRVDAIVVESGFIGQIGKLGMWGLGFGAGWRLRDAVALSGEPQCFTIRPDGKTGWRAALPERPGCFQKFDGYPGDVIVARLRVRYGAHAPTPPGEHPHKEHAFGPGYTDDMIEAMGIAEAAAAILARPKAAQRRALKAVRFG